LRGKAVPHWPTDLVLGRASWIMDPFCFCQTAID